jgi:predicted HAD superfamily Cof-like phosphohydrolase
MMHLRFGINHERAEATLAEKEFRIKAFREEVQEFEDSSDPAEELDALVDLVVFAMGTVERRGWENIFDEAYERVMEANMAKEVGPNQKRGNYALDLVKPDGWKAADLSDLIIKAERELAHERAERQLQHPLL